MTNFVLFRVERDRRAFIEALRARNVLMDEYAHGQIRAVTHHDVAAADIDHDLAAVREALDDTAPHGPSSAHRGGAAPGRLTTRATIGDGDQRRRPSG